MPSFPRPLKALLRNALLFTATAGAAYAQPIAVTPPRRDAAPAPLFPGAAPICPWEDLRKVAIPNVTIDSVTIDPTDGSCRVTATVNHPPADDGVKVFIALPLKGWNGRFRGAGGGGFSGGSANSLRGPVGQGYVAGATDTGHEGSSGSFALRADGRLNWPAIQDNAYRGIHDMTVVGKALTQAFYGKAPRYSYFVGSSTGGRQALMEAQRYPEDYDGILAGCPAINWHRFLVADLWPQVVMLEARNFVSKAKLDAATSAAVAACDSADGVVDGVIDDPGHCPYDPKALVGTPVGDGVFSAADADVVRKIWDGPRGHDGKLLWPPLTRGTDLSALGETTGSPLTGKPFSVAFDWVRFFLAQNPAWDVKTLTRAEFELLVQQAAEQYGAIFGADDPNLAPFRDRGGKVIITHGLADQLIPAAGSVDYYERVQRQMGGAERTAEFARLFLVPGVNHGFRGAGPGPTGLMDAIIRWVEEGKAPDVIDAELRDPAGRVVRTRPLFPYPQFAKYKGTGSTDDAVNFARTAPAR